MKPAMRTLVSLLIVSLWFVSLDTTSAAVNLSASAPEQVAMGSGAELVDAPRIISLRGRTVRVFVPAGYEQVTVERLVKRRPQTWNTAARGIVSAEGGEVSLKLNRVTARKNLRVLGRKVVPVPPAKVSSGRPSNFTPVMESGGGLTLDGNVSGGTLLNVSSGYAGNAAGDTGVVTTREVVESDIWKLHGDRLYVFNAYRGLQVLDLENPAEPVLLGSLYLPNAGDALYLVDDTHVALLTRRDPALTWQPNPPQAQSSLVICNVADGSPEIVATLPLDGRIVESRLVGTALYVATSKHGSNGIYWSEALSVTGFDLSDPANPVKRNTITLSLPKDGYSNPGPVQASDDYFLVTEQRWPGLGYYKSRVSLVDISSPDGTVSLRGSVSAAGTIADKFKMHERDGTLTLISETRGTFNTRHTVLENFNLEAAGTPPLVGSLAIAPNETLRGTRFDGSRVYVVTFEQIDPLWIVDNSSPAKPTIVGHLEVPGFSTYLEPLGDRLVTIGLLDNRVTVSLFDVTDPAKPAVLSQLPVTEAWTWSEATWNEKAFSVNPEAGLIMVPVNGSWSNWFWDPASASSGGIQLIDLERQQLRRRGKINRNFVPRRSEFHRGTIVALSDTDLLTADTKDRDHPAILAEVQLAWKTTHVWPVGNYLVQVGADVSGRNPVISIADKTDPNGVITTVSLDDRPVVAADLRDGLLYVAQGNDPYTTTSVSLNTQLNIFDVTSLPQVVRKGSLNFPGLTLSAYNSKMLWPQPGTLVLAAEDYPVSRWPIFFIHIGAPLDGITFATTTASLGTQTAAAVDSASLTAGGSVTLSLSGSSSLVASNALWYPYPWSSSSRIRLLACDVTDPSAPAFLQENAIEPQRGGSFSEVLASDGKIFATFQNGWGYVTFFTLAATDSNAVVGSDAPGKHHLHVIDYADPSSPHVRPSVSAPGKLKGVSRAGTVIFTEGCEYDETGVGIAGRSGLHASLYDGQKLELVSQLSLERFANSVVDGETVLAFHTKATPETDNKLAGYISLWEVQADLQFVERDTMRGYGYNAFARDRVLFSSYYTLAGHALSAFDYSAPGDLKFVGWVTPPELPYGIPRMTGDRAAGFWIPGDDYGVFKLEIPAP